MSFHCTHVLCLKVVQTDETARKPDHVPISSEDERIAIFQLEKALSSNKATKSKGPLADTLEPY